MGLFGNLFESREQYRPIRKLWFFIHPCYDEYYGADKRKRLNTPLDRAVLVEAYPKVRLHYSSIVESLKANDALCIVSYLEDAVKDTDAKQEVSKFIKNLARRKATQTLTINDSLIDLKYDRPYLSMISELLKKSTGKYISPNTEIFATGERYFNCLEKYSLKIFYSGRDYLKNNKVLHIPKFAPDFIIKNYENQALGYEGESPIPGYDCMTMLEVEKGLVNRGLQDGLKTPVRDKNKAKKGLFRRSR